MVLTYALAKQVLDALTYEANILADLAGQGVDLTGYDDLSMVKAVCNEQGRARLALAQLRAQIVGLVDPTTAPAAGDDWIDVHFGGFFQEPRLPALPAIGTLSVSVASGLGPYTYQAGDLLVEDVTTGAYYQNTNTAPQAVTSSSPATLAFTAQTPGAAGNPLGGDTFKLVSGPSGSSLGVTVGSWTTTTGGREAEGSIAYIARCLSKWGSLGAGGNIDAYNYWIPTGTPTITAWQIDDSNPGGPGTTWAYLADGGQPASGPELTSVGNYINARRALGSGPFTPIAAPQTTVAVTATLTQDGTNPSAITNAGAALALLQGAYGLGPVIDPALLDALLRGMPVPFAKIGLTGGGSRLIQINAPGFGGVTGVALFPTGPVSVPFGNVVQLDGTIT